MNYLKRVLCRALRPEPTQHRDAEEWAYSRGCHREEKPASKSHERDRPRGRLKEWLESASGVWVYGRSRLDRDAEEVGLQQPMPLKKKKRGRTTRNIYNEVLKVVRGSFEVDGRGLFAC